MWLFKKRIPDIRLVVQHILDFLEEDKLWEISTISGDKRHQWDFKLTGKDFRIKYGWKTYYGVHGSRHTTHNFTFIPEHNFNCTRDECQALRKAIRARLSRHEGKLDREQLANCLADLLG